MTVVPQTGLDWRIERTAIFAFWPLERHGDMNLAGYRSCLSAARLPTCTLLISESARANSSKLFAHRSQQDFHVVPDLPLGTWVSEQISGVACHDDLAASVLEELATHSANGLFRLQQRFGGNASEAANKFRLQDLQLANCVRPAIGQLVLGWISIPGRPTFYGIQYIDIFPLHFAGFDDAI